MSHATTFGSLIGAAALFWRVKPRPPQAEYDAVLRAAQNPRERALRLAREARFAGMRAKS